MDPGAGMGPALIAAPARDDSRMRALMDAVVSMSSELDLTTVLERLVIVACQLTGARYGALGVVDGHGGLSEFVHHGVDETTRRTIGNLPRGRGVLGHLIQVPEPLRLHDLSTHPTSVGFPSHHPSMRTFLGVPVRARGAVFGNLYLTEKLTAQAGAADFTAEDEEILLALAAGAGVAIDHSRAYARAHEHERWLEAAVACTSALTRGSEVQRGAALVVERAVGVAAADGGVLLTRRTDVPDGLVRCAVEATGPQVLSTEDGSPIGVTGPAWLLAVPLHSAERWIGALLLGWHRDHRPPPAVDLAIVAAFAEQLALALDVAAAQADRARLAVLEERERIARDLHDMVIQRLFAVGLNVQGVAQDDVPAEVAARLDRAVDELDETIKDIRAAIFRLGTRPASEVDGLRSRIDVEILLARETLGFLPRLRIDGVTAAVPRDVADDAVAVVREALANTARHAGARSAVVEIDVGAELAVTVRDDGVGPPATLTRHSGIANADARARRHGGSLALARGPSGGTALTWSVPLDQE